jgi:hypothetical protein
VNLAEPRIASVPPWAFSRYWEDEMYSWDVKYFQMNLLVRGIRSCKGVGAHIQEQVNISLEVGNNSTSIGRNEATTRCWVSIPRKAWTAEQLAFTSKQYCNRYFPYTGSWHLDPSVNKQVMNSRKIHTPGVFSNLNVGHDGHRCPRSIVIVRNGLRVEVR